MSSNVAHRADKTMERLDIVAARKRLALTQEQMANALNVTKRTLQNWESGLGTSQMPKKTRALRELLGLMDDYVLAPKEREWLDTPLQAVQNRRPADVIFGGKLWALIVEFQRLKGRAAGLIFNSDELDAIAGCLVRRIWG